MTGCHEHEGLRSLQVDMPITVGHVGGEASKSRGWIEREGGCWRGEIARSSAKVSRKVKT